MEADIEVEVAHHDVARDLGLSSIDMVIEQGLKLTKKQIEEYKDSIEEQDDE